MPQNKYPYTRTENSLKNSLIKAIEGLKNKINKTKLIEYIENNTLTYDNVIDINDIDDVFKENMLKALEAGLEIGATNGLKDIKQKINKAKVGLSEIVPELPFTMENSRVRDFLERRVAYIGGSISNTSIKAIETTYNLIRDRGYTPRQIAKRIVDNVGLTDRGALAVSNYEGSMLAKGLKQSVINKRIASYSKRLLNSRALTIARTETFTAINAGQDIIWQEGFDAGLMDKDKYMREWVTALDEFVCEYCEPMDTVRVKPDDNFDTGLGSLKNPPMHPSCRCTVTLEEI